MQSTNDILGINERNIEYVRRSNPPAAIRIANNKLLTKRLLIKNSIPTAVLHAVIGSTKDLDQFNWDILPESFVIKPNQGSGGEGIVVIRRKERDESSGATTWVTTKGEHYTLNDLKRHILNILDGNFSISNQPDVAFFEERIINHQALRGLTYKGTPDIRIIVYNGVPIMAMMRVSTKKSNGKANLAQGGIGIGIDLATGLTTTALVKKPRRHSLDKHPDTAEDLRDFQIPFWDEILEIAVRCQRVTGIGYLGADIALDKNLGPIVLELNARPGLEIQNVTRAGLAGRLRRVRGLKIDSVSKGIKVARELFGGDIERKIEDISGRHVIGLVEPVRLKIHDGKFYHLIARIDTSLGLSAIRESLANELRLEITTEPVPTEPKRKRKLADIEFYLDDERIATTARVAKDDELTTSLVIGKKDLQGFYIDPLKRKPTEKESKIARSKVLDKRLATISQRIPVLNRLRPSNYEEEKRAFFASSDTNPQFLYPPVLTEIAHIKEKLNEMKFDNNPIDQLLARKRDEDFKKVRLREHIGKPDFSKFAQELYGAPDAALVELALKEYRAERSANTREGREKPLKFKSTLAVIKKKMAEYGFPYKLVIEKNLPTRISIHALAGVPTIKLRTNARFTALELQGTLAHEIDTHMLRRQNALQQPYKIFLSRFADYLATEEGLAIYNKERIYKNPRRFDTTALLVIATDLALRSSFRETYNALCALGVSPEKSWSITFKVKRGMGDTSKPGAFTRYYLYFKGKKDIAAFVARGGDIRKLYIGKIGLRDLNAISKIAGVKPPRFLPK